MRFSTKPSKSHKVFENVCLFLLRRHSATPHLQLYANDGDAQDGVDIFDPLVTDPHRAAQCELHERDKAVQSAELRAEVRKARR
ncbi:hypothetical protein J0H58_04820 [bacterium]|nr:hypothetical protein [bacterium]